jgi:hypothetical protein
MADRVTHGRDFGDRVTVGDVVRAMADRIDAGDVRPGAVAELDRLFIFGAWGNMFAAHPVLAADVRGIAVEAYREGARRTRKRCAARCRAIASEIRLCGALDTGAIHGAAAAALCASSIEDMEDDNG